MINKKKFLSAAVTLSLVLGVYGVAGATDRLYGSTDTSKTVEGVTNNCTTTGVNKTTGVMEYVTDAALTYVDYTVNSGTWYEVYGGCVKSGEGAVSGNVYCKIDLPKVAE